MSQAVEEKPGDVWITVDGSSSVPMKYLHAVSTVNYPFGMNGPAQLSAKFNLTAYLRDMIAEAMGKT